VKVETVAQMDATKVITQFSLIQFKVTPWLDL